MSCETKIFSRDEVSKHNNTNSCWVVIDEQVYDVTNFLSKHPGGNLILVNPGNDCTLLFNSYHPSSAWKVLDKYHIGQLNETEKCDHVKYQNSPSASTSAPSDTQSSDSDYEDKLTSSDFYDTLRLRVFQYFKDKKIDHRFSWSLYIKTVIILVTFAIAHIVQFYMTRCILVSLVSAVVSGVATAMVGMCIGHDASHGAFSRNRGLCNLAMATYDLFGISSFVWKQEHIVGHHSHTNVHGYDPDVTVSTGDIRRFEPRHPWHPWHAYQHLYLAVLYGMLALRSTLVADILAIASGSFGPVQFPPFTSSDLYVMVGGKSVYVLVQIIMPLLYSCHSLPTTLMLYLVQQFTTGWVLACVFQVAHVNEGLSFEAPDNGVVMEDWARNQVQSTCNFAPRSWLLTHFTGGLNHQIEHHLFPSVIHTYYPAISSIVKSTCKEFDVTYVEFPSFRAALSSHFQHLQRMGLPTKIPTMG